MSLKWVLNFNKSQNQIWATRSSSGWVLIQFGKTTTSFQNFSIYIIYLKSWYFMNISSIFDFFSFLAEFREFFSTIEYSRPVEYSMGLKTNFWTTIFVKNLRFFSRDFNENWRKSRTPYPPPKPIKWGGYISKCR